MHTAKQYKDTQTVVKVTALGFAVSTSQHPNLYPLRVVPEQTIPTNECGILI